MITKGVGAQGLLKRVHADILGIPVVRPANTEMMGSGSSVSCGDSQ